MPAVEVAIGLFGVAVVRVLIVVARQFAAEVIGADAVRPGVVRQPGEMIGKAVLQLSAAGRCSWPMSPSSVCTIGL